MGAMLDALMGPNRDEVERDEVAAKEKFKDSTVCKGFLLGLCPFDASMLGGKRRFKVCERIHSAAMRSLLENHPDKEKLTQEYEEISLRDLEDAVRECDSHIGKEKQRIQTETRLRKPQLPLSVHDRLSMLKRQATNMMKQAEELDDDRIREKEAMINKVNEIMKDRETLTELEQKKAIESIVAEVSCEICGTCYAGEDENETHLRFRIHIAYKEIRDRLAELKPRVQEREKQRRDKKDEDSRRRRKEDWDKDKEKDGRRKDRTKEKDKDRDKEKETEKDKDDADKDKKEKDNAPDAEKEEEKKKKSRSGSREKSKDRGRGKDKGRRSRSGGDGSKERGRGKDRKGKDKRKRSASDSRKRDRSASGKKRRKASASRKRRSRSRDKRGRR